MEARFTAVHTGRLHAPPCDPPRSHLKPRWVCEHTGGGSSRHQKRRTPRNKPDDTKGSMKSFSRAANSVILPTNGFQMLQTQKAFLDSSNCNIIFKRNKKNKKEGRACKNVSLVNRIWCLMFCCFFFLSQSWKSSSERCQMLRVRALGVKTINQRKRVNLCFLPWVQ